MRREKGSEVKKVSSAGKGRWRAPETKAYWLHKLDSGFILIKFLGIKSVFYSVFYAALSMVLELFTLKWHRTYRKYLCIPFIHLFLNFQIWVDPWSCFLNPLIQLFQKHLRKVPVRATHKQEDKSIWRNETLVLTCERCVSLEILLKSKVRVIL
jgi:hypothetical protein